MKGRIFGIEHCACVSALKDSALSQSISLFIQKCVEENNKQKLAAEAGTLFPETRERKSKALEMGSTRRDLSLFDLLFSLFTLMMHSR